MMVISGVGSAGRTHGRYGDWEITSVLGATTGEEADGAIPGGTFSVTLLFLPVIRLIFSLILSPVAPAIRALNPPSGPTIPWPGGRLGLALLFSIV